MKFSFTLYHRESIKQIVSSKSGLFINLIIFSSASNSYLEVWRNLQQYQTDEDLDVDWDLKNRKYLYYSSTCPFLVQKLFRQTDCLS